MSFHDKATGTIFNRTTNQMSKKNPDIEIADDMINEYMINYMIIQRIPTSFPVALALANTRFINQNDLDAILGVIKQKKSREFAWGGDDILVQ